MFYLILFYRATGDREFIMDSTDGISLALAADALEGFLGPDFGCQVLDAQEFEHARTALGQMVNLYEEKPMRASNEKYL